MFFIILISHLAEYKKKLMYSPKKQSLWLGDSKHMVLTFRYIWLKTSKSGGF